MAVGGHRWERRQDQVDHLTISFAHEAEEDYSIHIWAANASRHCCLKKARLSLLVRTMIVFDLFCQTRLKPLRYAQVRQ
jgi:hypothetical protein